MRPVWITIYNVDQCARAARPEPREAANGNARHTACWSLVQTALAGFPRAPRAHIRPASPNHPRDDPRRADRARGAPYFTGKLMDASRWHRRPAQRSEIGNRRSSDGCGAAAEQQVARRRSSAAAGRAACCAGGEAGCAACRFAGEAAPLHRRRSRPRSLLRRRRSRPRGLGRAPAYPARLPLRAKYGCAPTTDARFLQLYRLFAKSRKSFLNHTARLDLIS